VTDGAPDYRTLVGDELHDIAELVGSLDDAQLDAPSLCEGWRVRDVAAHMASGSEATLPQVLAAAARRGSIAKASYLMAISYADRHSAADLAETLHRFAEDYASGKKKDGLARIIKPHELQLDNLIHEQDIRRPLGLPRQVPKERVVAALDTAPSFAGLVKCKQRAAGLHLSATDVGWSWGSGPDVTGAATDLLLALGGRPAALDGLDGEGVATLATRVKAT
jgi:uncharacterized protein (TIGR03083 family)